MRIVVAFGSYIGPHSNETNGCIPASFSGSTGLNLFTGVKTAGACKNDILVSVSTNGGTSFTGTTTDPRMLPSAASTRAQAKASQWFQWLAFTKDGTLAISYYDRQYGNDETTGYSDISISGTKDFSRFGVKRATSSSMPPPTQFSGTFGRLRGACRRRIKPIRSGATRAARSCSFARVPEHRAYRLLSAPAPRPTHRSPMTRTYIRIRSDVPSP